MAHYYQEGVRKLHLFIHIYSFEDFSVMAHALPQGMQEFFMKKYFIFTLIVKL